MKFKVQLALALLLVGGCTHHQLTRSTVQTTSTVMDIQYRIVLMNLAKLSCHPEAYPSHIDLVEGVVQINDRLGFGNAGGFTSLADTGFGIEQFGPDGQRQITAQWGADAKTNPERLTEMQDLYRAALGLPPLPPPNAILYLRHVRTMRELAAEKARKNENKNGDKNNSKEEAADFQQIRPATIQLSPTNDLVLTGGPDSPGGGGTTLSSANGNGNGDSRVPIEILLTDVPPPGWYHVGCKKDVPKDACYVGCYGDCYVWVMPEGIPALARFTITLLSVIKDEPGVGATKPRGLAFTR